MIYFHFQTIFLSPINLIANIRTSRYQVLKTKEVSNSDSPIFNESEEFLTEEFVGSELTFKVDDNDVWPNSDDPIGAYKLRLTQVRQHIVQWLVHNVDCTIYNVHVVTVRNPQT